MANLTIEQKSVRHLFQDATSTFLIPDYQRPYAWGEDECRTLWDDIFNFAFPDNNPDLFNSRDEYFLGPIVTFRNQDGCTEVIDGQQRLTTLMLLMRAFYNWVGDMEDPRSKAMKQEIEKCIWKADEFGNFDPNNLKIDSQVASDNDKEELLAILRGGKTDKMKSRYAQNLRFFSDQVLGFLHKSPMSFAFFPARLLNNCVLLPIEAESQDAALRIFTTLNDRGKPLADADIFKSQLYKFYSSKGTDEKDSFMQRWRELEEASNEILHPIYGTPLDELFTRYMYYQRALMGIKSSTVESLRKFYESGGKKEGNNNEPYPLLHREETMRHLSTLLDFWRKVDKRDDDIFTEPMQRRLFILDYAPNGMWRYLVSVYYLHLTLSGGKLEEEAFCRLLDRLIGFVWAYAITRPGLNSLRTPLFEEMVNIVKGKEVAFEEYRISEQEYRAGVEAFTFSNNRPITKAMLAWWAQSREDQPLLPQGNYDTEHIYPRNRHKKEQPQWTGELLEELGNKSLLEKRINIGASDYHFADKVRFYRGEMGKKGATQIKELLDIGDKYQDFGQQEIHARDREIINGFVAFLASNDLLRQA